MFFQCPKCKKIWQYPIEQCLDCFVDLERMETKKSTVVGVCKTNIATVQHAKVPYYALLLEDEKGNRWVQKSDKEYKKGEELIYEPAKNRDAVAIWRIKYDVLEGLERAVDLIGGLAVESQESASHINPETKILILPTLDFPKHPYFVANTNPRFLENTVKYLIQKGASAKNIKVAAQSFNEIPIEASAQKSLLFKTCLECGIAPFDLSPSSFIKKSQGGMNFEVSSEVFDSNLIINLPILKTGKASCSENVLKFLKKENYLGLKYLFSNGEILEKLKKVLPPYLNIADSEIIQKSNQATVFAGLVFAGYNSFNLDRVFNEAVVSKEMPDYIKKIKVEDIKISGRTIEEVQSDTEKL